MRSYKRITLLAGFIGLLIILAGSEWSGSSSRPLHEDPGRRYEVAMLPITPLYDAPVQQTSNHTAPSFAFQNAGMVYTRGAHSFYDGVSPGLVPMAGAPLLSYTSKNRLSRANYLFRWQLYRHASKQNSYTGSSIPRYNDKPLVIPLRFA